MAAVCFWPTFAHVLQIQQVLCTHSCLFPPPWGAQVHGLIPGRVRSESNQVSTQWTFQDSIHFQLPLVGTVPQFSCKRQPWLNPDYWQPNSAPSLPEHQQVQQQFMPWLETVPFLIMVTSSSLTHIKPVSIQILFKSVSSETLSCCSIACLPQS